MSAALPAPQPATSRKPCNMFLKGNCRFGDRCKFEHVALVPVSPGQRGRRRARRPAREAISSSEVAGLTVSAEQPVLSPPKPGPTRGERPCLTWNKTGTCPKGVKCWYNHDPLVRDALDRRREEELKATRLREEEARARQAQEEAERQAQAQARLERERRIAEEEECRRYVEEQACLERERVRQAREEQVRLERERVRQAREVQEEADRRARETAAEVRFQARSQTEAAVTLQRVIAGSIVTFAAGLEVQHIITGFDCCVVKIKGLPVDAREDEVVALFTQQGVEPSRFQFVDLKGALTGRKAATIVTASDLAGLLTFALNEVEFRDETIDFEIGTYNVSGGMGASAVRDADVLTVSWKVPSLSYIAEFDDRAQAQAKVRELHRRLFDGRRLRVEMNTPPPGRVVFGFNFDSIKISNVSSSSSFVQVQELVGTFRLRCLPNRNTSLPEADALGLLLREAEAFVPGKIVNSTRLDRTSANDGDSFSSYRIRLASPEDARVACDGLQGRLSRTIFPALSLKLPDPMNFNLTIPREQHTAQKTLWDSLLNGITDRKLCNLFIRPDGNVVRIRLSGSEKRTVGMLKVRVENLAMGEVVPGWHRSLGFAKNMFHRRVFHETQAYCRADWKKQMLRVYGNPRTIERAQAMIKAELERLESLEFVATLKQSSVAFFVRQGIATLKELVGEDTVTFQPWARRITITGGEEARHHLFRLIDESIHDVGRTMLGEQQCPICFDDVSNPHRLGCGHTYCTACLRHFLTSAVEGDQFPLLCMGDESRCGRPIALPTIQKFLPQTKFIDLLDSAVESYIKKHPAEIKHCRTPDCTQIYRATEQAAAAVALQCPSCFTEVCSGCSEDAHKGVSCEEQRRNARWNIDDQWMEDQGFKKCPACSALIEKTEGCNHMECRCGAHICWVCVRLFDAEVIYTHMREAHGGIYDAQNAPAPNVDINEQYEAIRQAEMRWQAEPVIHGARADRNHHHHDLFGFDSEPQPYQNPYYEWEAARVRAAQREREVQIEREAEARRQRELEEARRRVREANLARARRIEEERRQEIHQAEQAWRRRLEAEQQARRLREEEQARRRREDGSWCVVM